MTLNSWLQILLYLAVLLALVRPLGAYMASVYDGRGNFLDPVLGRFERALYRLAGVEPTREMNWRSYALSLLLIRP